MGFEIEGNPYNLNKLTDFEEYLKNKSMNIEMSENNIEETASDESMENASNGELEKFKKVQHPKTLQKREEPHSDIWSFKDMAATLNFRHVLFGLREEGKQPKRFCRSKTVQSVGTKRKESLLASGSRPAKTS
ncbi:hypothetical protein BDF14DRAFT_1880366 [Spinellus fusiger]|nr:hypothetical protein BDF14DRAFT_1880366 [Spinellus fusiger]